MRGMTWDHPRGHDPLIAASERWRELTGTVITWDRRSLQDFESHPVEELARRYDLIVIDHPHVGVAAATGALAPFTGDLTEFSRGSVGASFASYEWQGTQWALPIDAAAQVHAWVPTRLNAPAANWPDVMRLAAAGHMALPLRPPHSLMSLMTLCGLHGIRLDVESSTLFPDAAVVAFDMLRQLANLCPKESVNLDPIAVLEEMATPESKMFAAPLIYGYVSYATEGFRPVRIAFTDLIAAAPGAPPRGSVLGGTGIAVSAFAPDRAAAVAFARWIASGTIQRTIVSVAGGQPAHAEAWEAADCNAATLDFYGNTRRTLDYSWVRPRHDGYMSFQHAASVRINAALTRELPPIAVLKELNGLFNDHRTV